MGFPVDNKSMIWREVPWSKAGFKEYPWTLNSMKAGLACPFLHHTLSPCCVRNCQAKCRQHGRLLRQAAAYDPVLPQVYASYRYRRDLADAAKIAGVFGRSRALKREEAEQREVSTLSTTSPSRASIASVDTCLSASIPHMPP